MTAENKAKKKVKKLLGLEKKPLTKAQLIEELCEDVDNWDLENLVACTKTWRASLLKKQSVTEIRAIHREEIRNFDVMDEDEEEG